MTTLNAYYFILEKEMGNPLQYPCLENPMDKGAWVGYSPWSRKELDTIQHTHTQYFIVSLCPYLFIFMLSAC